MNSQKTFIHFLQDIHSVRRDIMDEYISCWEDIRCARREILVSEGDTEKYLYFVIDGIQCSFYHKGLKMHVIHLTYSPALIAVPESFLLQKPSRYSLECITESQLLRISYQKHLEMMDKYPQIERLIRKALETIVIEMVQWHHELMAYSIKERFTAMMQRNPELINLVPHKYLASYLNIDASNFSRLLNSQKI